jgi:UDP-glucose 6-dehydrogenase
VVTKYTYSISRDTLNGKVDTTKLQYEIQISLIAVAVEQIDTNGDLLEIIMKSDLSSQETGYLDGVVAQHDGVPMDHTAKVTVDNKLYVKNTARPIGTFSCFSSYGDDISNPHDVGGGSPLNFKHTVGQPSTQYLYADFNVIENKTFLQEGYALWDKAVLDRVIMEVVPQVTVYTSGTNTFFNVYGGYLVVPAAGDGYANIHPEDMR